MCCLPCVVLRLPVLTSPRLSADRLTLRAVRDVTHCARAQADVGPLGALTRLHARVAAEHEINGALDRRRPFD